MATRRHALTGRTAGRRPRQRAGPPIVPVPPDWTRHAACTAGQADRLFYADPDDPDETDPNTAAERQAEAQAVCAACPVRDACAAEMQKVDKLHNPHGVWAGITPAKRTPRKRARTPNKTNAAIAARAAADPRGPIPMLSEIDFDADVLRFANQGHTNTEIATHLNRPVRDVELARARAIRRRNRAARRTQRRIKLTANKAGAVAA